MGNIWKFWWIEVYLGYLSMKTKLYNYIDQVVGNALCIWDNTCWDIYSILGTMCIFLVKYQSKINICYKWFNLFELHILRQPMSLLFLLTIKITSPNGSGWATKVWKYLTADRVNYFEENQGLTSWELAGNGLFMGFKWGIRAFSRVINGLCELFSSFMGFFRARPTYYIWLN